jgi:hypothetical protein
MPTPNFAHSPLHRDQAITLMKLSGASHKLAFGLGDHHELRAEFLTALNEANAVARQMGEACAKPCKALPNDLSQADLDTYIASIADVEDTSESTICASQG